MALIEQGPHTQLGNGHDVPYLPLLSARDSAVLVHQLKSTTLSEDTRLADLPAYRYQVEATTIVNEVDEQLRRYLVLPGVIVTGQGTALGVISRRKFFEQLGQLYGVAVHMRRSIDIMLRSINAEPLILEADTKIPEAVRKALQRPTHSVYDPIAVDHGRQVYRLLDVYTLLYAQSNLFATLQQQLQSANSELEQRVAQRTSDLRQTNTRLLAEISRRQQVQDELVAARDEALTASRLKSQLLSKVSHELRTPLGGILGNAELLHIGSYGSLSNEQKRAIQRIIDSTNYLTAIVNDLLDQAQIDASNIELIITPLELRRFISDVAVQVKVLADVKGLKMRAAIDPRFPELIMGDEKRLKQILVNLLGNAVKFTREGEVRLKCYLISETEMMIEVQDTGIGIESEYLNHIFEPFGQVDSSMTREHRGTGLGLSIVKQLVERMKGTITVSSQVGHGSTFRIKLPFTIP